MGGHMNLNGSNEIYTDSNKKIVRTENNLVEITEGILLNMSANIQQENVLSMPIAELATLGAGVSSLIPKFRTVVQTTTMNTQGLYQLANAEAGDVLKSAKNGNYWGAFKTAEGKSKFAQLQSVDSLSATNKTIMPINPSTMMMAVALFSIEQKLGDIAEMEKQILSFLEIEKQSEIEADVETLYNIISQYKYNWDNEHFIASNHKMVLDIQRTARKHMKSYKKKIMEVMNSKQLIVAQATVNSTMRDLQKKFKYYRLSLYALAMSSLIEIMLSGNFKEENILGIKSEIEKYSHDYRSIYTQCSTYLEKMSCDSLETNILKSIGSTSKAIGKLIENIPFVKENSVDEFFKDGGVNLKKSAEVMEKDVVESFAEISNPYTSVFVEKMNDMIQIYNHTSKICFDEKKIYLFLE